MTERWRVIAQWAALGALSGTLATLAIFIPQWLGVYDFLEFEFSGAGLELNVSPLSVAPGLVFGLLVGHALRRRGLAPGGRYPAYIASAGLSYFLTVQIAMTALFDLMDDILAIGAVAGAIGAALLGAATAAMMPQFRNSTPLGSMVLAGAILGLFLWWPIAAGDEQFFGWLLLFAPWQAGHAAAMATAFAAGDTGRQTSREEGIQHWPLDT